MFFGRQGLQTNGFVATSGLIDITAGSSDIPSVPGFANIIPLTNVIFDDTGYINSATSTDPVNDPQLIVNTADRRHYSIQLDFAPAATYVPPIVDQVVRVGIFTNTLSTWAFTNILVRAGEAIFPSEVIVPSSVFVNDPAGLTELSLGISLPVGATAIENVQTTILANFSP